MLLAAAVACWMAAAAVVLMTGLPERAAYSGVVTSGGVRSAPEIGALAPPFRTSSLNGEADSADWLGQPVVLNFWATWCVPCAVEMPELQQVHEAFETVRVIGVNLGESPAAVQNWAETYGLTFELAFDPDGSIARLYALRGQPSTFVIAPDGKIRHIYFGATDSATLSRDLLPLVG
ncbi:MAG: TlpA family protein disulfide reductase [Chloroflexi bacterium]|nr:TlpA family protein disulfide reductase [Chloroflexota bacterium]